MFVGRIPIKYLALMLITGFFALSIFVGGSLLLNKEGRIATWKNRIEAYMDGEGDNYQADQAKVAIVQGGMFGKGPGNSTQRNLLPHPYSDFIYAIIIEEYGSLIGGVLMVALYLWLFFRAGLIVRRSRSTYGAFLAYGLSLGLVLQAFVNMAVAVGLVPVTGQTLPLVSMGGSSIFFTSLATGMILSVSWGTKEVESRKSKVESEKSGVKSQESKEQSGKSDSEKTNEERELAKEAVKAKRASKGKKDENIRSKRRESDTNQVEFEING
jgi:cell division protein FtsW